MTLGTWIYPPCGDTRLSCAMARSNLCYATLAKAFVLLSIIAAQFHTLLHKATEKLQTQGPVFVGENRDQH